MSVGLTPEKALIFRIVHRDNLPWFLDNGVHCANSNVQDPNYTNIGNPELIEKRHRRSVNGSPGGVLSDYIPFYFTPFSPMLYNIRTGYGGVRRRSNEEIVIMVSSLHALRQHDVPFVFTDRHAYLEAAQFYSDLAMLGQIDWPALQARDFRRDPDDPGKFERYQAEALVHRSMPIAALLGLACWSESVASCLRQIIADRGLSFPVFTKPGWYFQ